MRRAGATVCALFGCAIVVQQNTQPLPNGGFMVAGIGLLMIGFLLYLPEPRRRPSTPDELAERRALRDARRELKRQQEEGL